MTALKDRHSIDRILREQKEALHGFTVTTIDGEAGHIANDQDRVDPEHLVIHLDGFLGVFGHDVVVENEAVDVIDTVEKVIHIDRIADWVKSSPKIEQFQDDHDTLG